VAALVRSCASPGELPGGGQVLQFPLQPSDLRGRDSDCGVELLLGLLGAGAQPLKRTCRTFACAIGSSRAEAERAATAAWTAVLHRDQHGSWRVTEARHLPDGC
jgi:hypothetical protein